MFIRRKAGGRLPTVFFSCLRHGACDTVGLEVGGTDGDGASVLLVGEEIVERLAYRHGAMRCRARSEDCCGLARLLRAWGPELRD